MNIHQDYATAHGRGPPEGLQFNPVLVDVPGEFPRTLVADVYFDGIVNFRDFAVLAGEWLDEEDWYSPPYTGEDLRGDLRGQEHFFQHVAILFCVICV